MTDDLEIVARLELALRGVDCFGVNDESCIDDAEVELGLSLPPSYRLFLQNFGAALAVYEIAGLSGKRSTDLDPPYWSNVIDDTLQMRRATKGNIPYSYVRISGDGGDLTFYLDTSTTNCVGECRVVALGPGMDSVEIASSFVDFVEKAQTNRLFPDIT